MQSVRIDTCDSSEVAPIDTVVNPRSFADFAASTQAPACHADNFASPALADAWANAIVTSWQAAYSAGQLNPAQPLYLLDLAPGDGHLAHLLLRALRKCMGEAQASFSFRQEERDMGQPAVSIDMPEQMSVPASSWTIRYLACARSGSNEHKLGDDRFDTILWSPLDGNALPPSNRHAWRWGETGNPLTVIALNYLQAFPGQLRAVHYGSWLEGRVVITAEHPNSCELEYDWQEIINDGYCPAVLRQHYLRTLSNSCVLIPDAGLSVLGRIAELSHGRFLWLALDQGIVDEKQLRFGAMSPPATWSYETQPVPVNFHALAYAQARRGAWCWHGQQHEEGMVVQVIWRHDGIDVTHGDYLRLTAHLQRFHPDDTVHLATLASALMPENPPALHLALLHSAHHDPRVLRAALTVWVENPPQLTDAERSHWGDAIARAWEVCPRGCDEVVLRHSMAVCAVRVGRLDIARAIFEHDGNYICTARCHVLGGRIGHALSCLAGIDGQNADALRSELQQRLARWQTLGWYSAEESYDGELGLVPLDEDHAQELYEQYRDPQIGEMTRLPEMDTPEAAREWIAEQHREPGRATYALMHANIGLIGVVSTQANGEDAYFYFWVGSDHQKQGFGRRAGRLLYLQAERAGLKRLFTSAYHINHRSIDALNALGFRILPLRAIPPDDDLLFFVRDVSGNSESLFIWRERLIALLAANASPIQLSSRKVFDLKTAGCSDWERGAPDRDRGHGRQG